MFILPVIILLLIHKAASSCSVDQLNDTYSLKIGPEDGGKNFMRMTKNLGYSAVEYQITTEDGYILTLFNIPGNVSRPVLMSHGIFDSADGWIIRGNNSMAPMLAEAGYDVWMLNQRGSRYSRRHKTLDPDKDAEFWNFSLHELGMFDQRACMDFVLNKTKQSQLSLIGFSEGTSMSFVQGATHPEQNKKVKISICLAPIAYLHNAIGPLDFLIKFASFFNFIIPSFINEIAGYYSISRAFIKLVCTKLPFGYDLCFRHIVSNLIGPNVDAIDTDFFNEIVENWFPAGTSKKNLMHYAQIGQTGEFGMYDYGKEKNMEKYGTEKPPNYDLKKVTMPVVLISGKNDLISTETDVQLLYDQLPNVVGWKMLDDHKYNHLDLMWAETAHDVVYRYVLETMARYH